MISTRPYRPWTQRDDDLLQWHYGSVPIDEICEQLSRSRAAITRRAHHLGLRANGCVRGYETLEAASRRTGYRVEQLKRIIRGSRIVSRRAEGYRERHGKKHWKLYRIEDIDACVESYHETETFYVACDRLGVHPRIMTRILASLGVVKPEGRKRQLWRVPSDMLDRAAEMHRGMTTPGEYAKEHGISRAAITRRMVEFGLVKPADCFLWYVSRTTLDAIMQRLPILRVK